MSVESIGFGVIILFMLLGLVGSFLPLMPGPLLVWLAALVYAAAGKFTVVSPASFAVISLIALVAVTADIWMSYLGAKTLGASSKAILWGVVGAVLGFLLLNLLGAVLGYALGILVCERRKHGDWRIALKASVGGMAGWGLATAVQAAGSLLIIVIFIWQVFWG